MSRIQDARRLASDTAASGSWMLLRLLSLGIWVVVMARLISAAEFGWLASTLGIAAVCAMFVGAGIPYLFFTDAHEDSPLVLEARWSELLGCLALLGPVLVLLSLVAIVIWLPVPVPVFLLLALLIVEIPLAGLVQSSALLIHAKRNFGAAAGMPALMTLGRALAAGCALAVQASLGGYIVFHLLAALLMAAVVLTWASAKRCRLVMPRIPSGQTLRAGSSYAVMAGGSLVNSELDKPVLARVAGLAVTGNYALAYRICAAAAMPVTALSTSMLPRWTRMLAKGHHRSVRRSFALMLLLVACASVAVSGLLQLLLGFFQLQEFGFRNEAVSLMHGLVWVIGPIGLHQLAGTALLAASRPLRRAVIDVAGLGLLAIAFLYFYTQMGIRGLALASVLAESVIAASMAIVFFVSISQSGSSVREESVG